MIYVECKPDQILVKFLGITRKNIIHAGNKSGVCKRLKNDNNSKGMVDEDPNSPIPTYMDRLNLLNEQNDIKIFSDNQKNNIIIVLCPRLEEWILKTSQNEGIDTNTYNLPNDINRLRRIINYRLNNFKRLLEDLKNSNRLKYLKSLLERN